MDNLFEATCNTARRIVEGLDDTNNLLLNSVWDGTFGFIDQDKIAKHHSDEINDQIQKSLRHNDVDGAAEQMRRELFFCSTVDGLSGTKNELAARAGLAAIEKGLPPIAIVSAMEHASDDPEMAGFYTKEPDVIDAKIKNYKEQYERDPDSYCHQRVKLKTQIEAAMKSHEPIDPKDRCQLAMYDLGFADRKANTEKEDVVRKYVVEANEQLKAAKKDGYDTSLMERILARVNSHFKVSPVPSVSR